MQGAEPPSSAASEASGREGRSARLRSRSPRGDLFIPLEPSVDLLPSSHTSGSVDAASKPASVARRYCRRAPHSGPTTANGFDSRPSIEGRARDHRELNRRDNPRDGSGKRGSQHPLRPAASTVDGKRKPGRVHVVRKALRAFRERAGPPVPRATRDLRSLGMTRERRSLTTRGRGAQCRCGKAPPSRSDRPPQGGRERVGRGSLRERQAQSPVR